MISLRCILILFISTTCFGCSYEPSLGSFFFLSKAKYTISNAIVIVTYDILYNKFEIKLTALYKNININLVKLNFIIQRVLKVLKLQNVISWNVVWVPEINPLKPKDPYRGRTAPLTSKRCIFIYLFNKYRY